MKTSKIDKLLKKFSNQKLFIFKENNFISYKKVKEKIDLLQKNLIYNHKSLKEKIVFLNIDRSYNYFIHLLALINLGATIVPIPTNIKSKDLYNLRKTYSPFTEINEQHLSLNKGFSLMVPGDISSAGFLIAGAILLPGSKIRIKNVLYNETRLKFIYLLKKMNANISIKDISSSKFEKSCTIVASYSPNLKSAQIDSECAISIIDEIPILSIIATQCAGKTVLNGLGELKYKESDRAMLIYKNLKNMGADISYSDDNIVINGKNKLYNASIIHENDHRIAMSFEILHLLLNNKVSHQYNDVISISFPDFYSTIESILQ